MEIDWTKKSNKHQKSRKVLIQTLWEVIDSNYEEEDEFSNDEREEKIFDQEYNDNLVSIKD